MPTTRPRPDPVIPDHEVLRRIGGGAYGEVWLARGVTGALRAVKVVWREDFDDERTFEREFEGILKYEPISRDHPGLVNVLHVGRSPDNGDFYYYVMELGDDITTGRDINPIEYEARTLHSDVKRAGGKRLDTGFCIDVGLRLAEALKNLHDQGLAHRDVKPSNVIFVNGRAKLADIGLVAARGQRTFVGTEGFVPPEGPGSAQADVYSLGKVLYEMATGKDRLDFPEGPDELPQGAERKQWLALNQVICDICEPHLSRRTIQTGGDLADAMAKLRAGKRRRRRRPIGAFLASMAVGAALVWVGWEALESSPWGRELVLPARPVDPPQRVQAFIKVTSTPDGADVIDASGKTVGRTPTLLLDSYAVGDEVSFRIIREGYQPAEIRKVVPAKAAKEPEEFSVNLKIDSPPIANEPWSDHLGNDFRPVPPADHESIDWVDSRSWETFLAETGRPTDLGEVVGIEVAGVRKKVVLTGEDEAAAYSDWLAANGAVLGYLTAEFEAKPEFSGEVALPELSDKARRNGWKPFRVRVRKILYGGVIVTTDPPGAEIYLDGVSRGAAGGSLLIDGVRPGEVEVLASLEGFKPETRTVKVEPNRRVELSIPLQENKSVILDRPWENSLGMKLVPAGKDWMASVWETRVADYQAFARATDRPMPSLPDSDIVDGGDHPVVSVSRNEALDFCKWLTEKEREEDRLTPSLEYRLPTDYEWSLLAGTIDEEDASPAMRERVMTKRFLWGAEWPPPPGVGNLADLASGFSSARTIEDYDDGYRTTAPVGSVSANALGIFDLCGNAWEWVEDSYSTSSTLGVLRGGGWKSYQEQSLYVGFRNPQPPYAAESTYGFRVILAKRRPEKSEKPETPELPVDEEEAPEAG